MGWRKQQLAGLKGFQMPPKMDLLMKRQLKQNHSLASEWAREVAALTFLMFADTFCITKTNAEASDCHNVAKMYHHFPDTLGFP